MVTRAARTADPPQDADSGIARETLTTWRERALFWQRTDLDRALAAFTFIADVTCLSKHCQFAGDDRTLVVRYDGLPFAAIAFHSLDQSDHSQRTPQRIAALTRRLVAPGQAFACLVAERDWSVVRGAYRVLDVQPEWQMVHGGDLLELEAGDAVPLEAGDLPQMRALARRESMQGFEHDPLSRGPWYGVWHGGELVAQGGTHVLLEHAAEIGNIVTAGTYRRLGYGSRVVAALLRELTERDLSVFLHVIKRNRAAVAFYDRLGFERRRTMVLARCCI